jgi:ribosomal protein S18 acetylase RimI-like enzyme
VTQSVRLALPAEAAAIAAVQRRSWTQVFPAPVAASVLDGVGLADMAGSWEAAITRPPLATLRVLVALDTVEAGRPRVVGFAALGPSADDDAEPGLDGEVTEFAIDPLAQRQGHGSRLLQACVDTLAADGFARARWWVRTGDDVVRAFLVSAGWAADGAHAEVGTSEDTRLKLVRLHTDITSP